MTITAAVSLLFAARGVEGRGSAEPGEGSFVTDPAGVLPRGDEERAGGVGADSDSFDYLARCPRTRRGTQLLRHKVGPGGIEPPTEGL